MSNIVKTLAVAGGTGLLGVTAAWSQLDPIPRSLIELGFEQPIRGQAPLAVYAYYYYNDPEFFRTNMVLRLAVAPTYLNTELGFRNVLSPSTDAGITVFGGGFVDDYYEIRQGNFIKAESFDGHGGGASLNVYQLLNPGDRIPLNAVLRGGIHYSTFARTDRTAPAFQVPDDQITPFVRTGLRFGGIPPELYPDLGMEVSVWYEHQWRLENQAYGFEGDRDINSSTHLYWLYAGLDYAWTNAGHQVSVGLTAGGSADEDRFSAWRLGGMLPLIAEFPLILPGYFHTEITARRFAHLSANYFIPLTSNHRWQAEISAATAYVDYLRGFEQPGHWHSGVGGGLSYTAPGQVWRVILRYGYGINARRDGDEGAHSVGILFQYDFEKRLARRREHHKP